MVKIIASKITIPQLEASWDKKDKLQSRLYMKKADELLSTTESKYLLQRCTYCNKLFPLQSQDRLKCQKAKIFIDFHGSVIQKHVSD